MNIQQYLSTVAPEIAKQIRDGCTAVGCPPPAFFDVELYAEADGKISHPPDGAKVKLTIETNLKHPDNSETVTMA